MVHMKTEQSNESPIGKGGRPKKGRWTFWNRRLGSGFTLQFQRWWNEKKGQTSSMNEVDEQGFEKTVDSEEQTSVF